MDGGCNSTMVSDDINYSPEFGIAPRAVSSPRSPEAFIAGNGDDEERKTPGSLRKINIGDSFKDSPMKDLDSKLSPQKIQIYQQLQGKSNSLLIVTDRCLL